MPIKPLNQKYDAEQGQLGCLLIIGSECGSVFADSTSIPFAPLWSPHSTQRSASQCPKMSSSSDTVVLEQFIRGLVMNKKGLALAKKTQLEYTFVATYAVNS